MKIASDTTRITDETEAVLLNHVLLSVGDVLRSLHRRGYLKSMLQKAADDRIILTHAQTLGFAPTDGQLQQAADEFRRRVGLLSVEQTQKWLTAKHHSELDFEEIVLREMRYRLVFSHVTEAAERDFQSASSLWDRMSYREFTVGSESLAEELKCQCMEEGVLFADLTAQHTGGDSSDSTPEIRKCFRNLLPNWTMSALPTAVSGSLVGPLACPSGWALIFVEAVTPAVFDQETESAIRKHLFQQWLSARIRESTISYPLLDLLSCQNAS